MYKILTIGELLIDFSPFKDENGNQCFKQNSGGAPANVAVQAAKLGAETFFIGKVGDDNFGHFLKNELEKYKVNTKGLVFDKENQTSLAFITLDNKGDRRFTFYMNNSADSNLSKEDINFKLIDECDIFHFGSLSLISEPSRTAVIEAVKYAKSKGKTITYDPNYREALWPSKKDAVIAMKSVLEYVDIIKVSEDELLMLTNCATFIHGTAALLQAGIRVVIATQGAKGCIVACRSGIETQRTYNVNTIDTTGAGDSFFGGFIYKLAESSKHILDVTLEELLEFTDFANACGSLCSTKKGAIPAMPDLEEIEDCRNNCKKL